MKIAALDLARAGVHVFPCRGKQPLTRNGFKDATTDPEEIEAWWSTTHWANIGIAAGASELVVIDIDTKHGTNGWRAFDECLERLGELPGPTRMASTPSGGAHLYFRAPQGVTIRNSAGKLGPGLDVRAVGGYVIAPPSEIDGKAYGWDTTEPARVLPLAWAEAMCPEKVATVAAINPPLVRPRLPDRKQANRYGVTVIHKEADIVAKASPGERNDTVTRCAFRVGRVADACGLTGAQAEVMFAWAVGHWADEREAHKASGSFWRAFEAGRKEPRRLELNHG